jgi:hypothetical protein
MNMDYNTLGELGAAGFMIGVFLLFLLFAIFKYGP